MTPDELINKALGPVNNYDACDQCGKRTDGLMTCTYPIDDSTTKLCPDCIKGSGFCLCCGHFSEGQQRFDFSNMPGYCGNCQDEIMSEMGEYDDNENKYDEHDEEDFPDGSLDY